MTRRDQLLALLQPYVGQRMPLHRTLGDRLGVSESRLGGLVTELRVAGEITLESGVLVKVSPPRPGSFAADGIGPSTPLPFDRTDLLRAREAERTIKAHAEELERDLAAAREQIVILEAQVARLEGARKSVVLRAWTALDIDDVPLASFASRIEAESFVYSTSAASALRREKTQEIVWRRGGAADAAQPLRRPRRRAA